MAPSPSSPDGWPRPRPVAHALAGWPRSGWQFALPVRQSAFVRRAPGIGEFRHSRGSPAPSSALLALPPHAALRPPLPLHPDRPWLRPASLAVRTPLQSVRASYRRPCRRTLDRKRPAAEPDRIAPRPGPLPPAARGPAHRDSPDRSGADSARVAAAAHRFALAPPWYWPGRR